MIRHLFYFFYDITTKQSSILFYDLFGCGKANRVDEKTTVLILQQLKLNIYDCNQWKKHRLFRNN